MEKTEILRIGDEHVEKEYIIVDADGNEIRNNHPFTPNSGFTLGTPVFTHFTSARQR